MIMIITVIVTKSDNNDGNGSINNYNDKNWLLLDIRVYNDYKTKVRLRLQR